MIFITIILVIIDWLIIKLFAWLDRSQPGNDAGICMAGLFLCLNAMMASVPNALNPSDTFLLLSGVGIIFMIPELVRSIKEN